MGGVSQTTESFARTWHRPKAQNFLVFHGCSRQNSGIKLHTFRSSMFGMAASLAFLPSKLPMFVFRGIVVAGTLSGVPAYTPISSSHALPVKASSAARRKGLKFALQRTQRVLAREIYHKLLKTDSGPFLTPLLLLNEKPRGSRCRRHGGT